MPSTQQDQSSRIAQLIEREQPTAIATRRDIHAHPELAYQEHRTHNLIVEHLRKHSIQHVPKLAGGTGVLAYLPATETTNTKQRAIAFRADTDALPINEQTDCQYASKTPGIMHACGHDGHTAILLTLTSILAQITQRPNPITFIFQPAEEGGAGAKKMCEDGALDGSKIGPPVSHIYALHGWPDLQLGHVATKPGPLLAATDTFEITITGKQAHAAFPHVSKDPIVTIANTITTLQTIISRNLNPLDSAVLTVGQLNAGTAVNIIPTTAHARGTLRTLRPETRELIRQRVTEITDAIATAHGCDATTKWIDGYPVTNNDPAATQHFFKTAKKTLGEQNVHIVTEPFMGGEDFAFYAQHIPACFFILGLSPHSHPQGSYPKLHTPKFDFNDDAIPTALQTLAALALNTPPQPA